MSLLPYAGDTLPRTLKTLHLYFGLFICPFVLLFAVSAILLNHAWRPGGAPAKPEVRNQENIVIRTDLESLPLAQDIMQQVGVSGEIEFFRYQPQQKRLVIPVMRPGWRAKITVDVARRTAQIEQRRTGFWDALLYLHKSPGPHLAGFRGNWIFTRIWGGLADATACLLLFLAASGVYLWLLLRSERRIGLILMGAGSLSFFALVLALAH